ncbi:hypothetical protein [Inhella gelatinilytica]|uniref:Uncharacterized protein n=1 Tax=Inhella gelatinilytica TaxID=2795030 RepID=A0A931J149_9BURK|nr:hypothetical protein [Inhella gelatinilytica]MBH9553598.1 hypothetical protein [Inhella gelatinilytica]
MSKFLKWVGWSSLILLVLSLALGSLILGIGLEHASDAGTWQVVVDGEDLWSGEVSEWMGTHTEHGPLGWIAAALACGFTVLVVVPLALMLGVGLPILVMLAVFGGLGLLFAGMSLAVLAPFLLPLLLVWWVLKRNRRTPVART